MASTEPSDYLSASSVVVLHPGSKWLRLGRASDPAPVTVLHAIARRRRNSDYAREEPFVEPEVALSGSVAETVEACRQHMISSLRTAIRSNGVQRFSVPQKHLVDLNAKVRPEKGEQDSRTEWLNTSEEEVIVGDNVTKLDPESCFNIHFPYRRGDLNLHGGIGGSQTSILHDLKEVWSWAIENRLCIPTSDLAKYRAVLIIPALYRRPLVKHLLSLLLVEMGFGGAFVVQDHVAATFGAGLGCACVVDIGDQKTSVSCVEDGISHPRTRVHLDYGGSDVTRILLFLLRKSGCFPFIKCDPDANRLDAQLLHAIKEEICHLDLDQCGVHEKTFNVTRPGHNSQKYKMFYGDDAIIAPASLFYPELLEVTGKKKMRFMSKDAGDPEDPHDHIYLSETSRKYTKAGAAEGETQDDDMDVAVDPESTSASASNVSAPSLHQHAASFISGEDSNLLALDAAIVKSIEACASDDLKRKMLSCILLVGDGARFRSIGQYLQARLRYLIPPLFRNDPLELIVDAKDMSAATTTWRGAAVMASLESAQELWIAPGEWTKHGQRLLREKAPFPWA